MYPCRNLGLSESCEHSVCCIQSTYGALLEPTLSSADLEIFKDEMHQGNDLDLLWSRDVIGDVPI